MPEVRFKGALIAQADIKPGHQVLDFGVGTATLLLATKRQVPLCEITGVDIDPTIIGIARRKIELSNLKVNIDQYDGREFPYPDARFDRVLSSLVFHHLTKAQKENALHEIGRVLKPGGELHVADFGKARSMLMRALHFPVQMFDGFETTADNVKGLLPVFMTDAGFSEPRETQTFSTMFGTLSLYKAIR